MRTNRPVFALLAILFTALMATPAAAACRDDLIKADQTFNSTRTNLQKAATAAPAVKCTAYRRHVASLTEVRKVFARCDTSASKAANAAQTNTALAEFTRQMQQSCKR